MDRYTFPLHAWLHFLILHHFIESQFKNYFLHNSYNNKIGQVCVNSSTSTKCINPSVTLSSFTSVSRCCKTNGRRGAKGWSCFRSLESRRKRCWDYKAGALSRFKAAASSDYATRSSGVAPPRLSGLSQTHYAPPEDGSVSIIFIIIREGAPSPWHISGTQTPRQ